MNREDGMEGRREGGRREGGRERGREGGREGRREGGREGGDGDRLIRKESDGRGEKGRKREESKQERGGRRLRVGSGREWEEKVDDHEVGEMTRRWRKVG